MGVNKPPSDSDYERAALTIMLAHPIIARWCATGAPAQDTVMISILRGVGTPGMSPETIEIMRMAKILAQIFDWPEHLVTIEDLRRTEREIRRLRGRRV